MAYTGFFINLINMIPLPPLDGGRITAVLSPRIWLLGVPIIGALLWFHFSGILLLVAILAGAARDGRRCASTRTIPPTSSTSTVTPRVRWEYGLLYVGLIAFLAYMTNEVDRQLSGDPPPGRRAGAGRATSERAPPRRPQSGRNACAEICATVRLGM